MKNFTFESYQENLTFVAQVGEICQSQNHHADILLTYSHVLITSTTHDQGNTLTKKDINLAEEIEQLAKK